MACTTSKTILNGFFIETTEANVNLAVINTFNEVIEQAEVTLDCVFSLPQVDLTNEQGCVSFELPEEVICDLRIEKFCYQLYNEKVIALAINQFNSIDSFAFRLFNNNSQVINASPNICFPSFLA